MLNKSIDRIETANVYLGCSFFLDINKDHEVWLREAVAALDENDTVKAVHVPWDHQYKNILMVGGQTPEDFGVTTFEWAQKTYENDIAGMSRADIGVFLIDVDNIDVGCMFEIGWMIAYDKPVIIVLLSSEDTLEKDFDGNLMLTQSAKYFMKDIGELKDYDFNHTPANAFQELGDNFKII